MDHLYENARNQNLIFVVSSLQMLVYLFYALPLLTVFIYGLNTPGCSWMLDWTIFFAGAVAQVRPAIVIAAFTVVAVDIL